MSAAAISFFVWWYRPAPAAGLESSSSVATSAFVGPFPSTEFARSESEPDSESEPESSEPEPELSSELELGSEDAELYILKLSLEQLKVKLWCLRFQRIRGTLITFDQ